MKNNMNQTLKTYFFEKHSPHIFWSGSIENKDECTSVVTVRIPVKKNSKFVIFRHPERKHT